MLKKGISAKQLQSETVVTYKCAWRILKQIRQAMEDKNNDKLYETIVEIDETYVGVKPRKSNKKDDDLTGGGIKRGRSTKKTPVVAVINREGKKCLLKLHLQIEKARN